eukprot:GEMP01038596.1.p1 GENE.GEMP01038596.1~~GEMP01038596.1.p1  ORF type:complete len:359 (+),score=30.70 GEMP01038596.1:101-1177(+)
MSVVAVVNRFLHQYFRYISDDGIKKLKTWKYVGGDYTLLDKLINPFWVWCETKTPRWMSPNAVTLLATTILFLCTSFLAVFGSQFENRTPLHLISIFAIFAYQTLDAVDGKHARALGMTSPFGSMLDHSCDCFSLFLQSVLIWLTISPSLDITFPYFLSYVVSQALFYVGQWAATFEKRLEHAGVTEAQFVGMCFPLATIIFGQAMWANKTVEIIFGCLAFLFFLGMGVRSALRVLRSFRMQCVPLLTPVIFVVGISIYVFISGIFTRLPLFVGGSIGMTLVLISLRLVISNMVEETPDVLHIMIPVGMLLAAAIIPPLFPILLVTDALLFVYVSYDTTKRVCTTLNLPIISVQLKSS